jgi:hypothetical protein
MRYLLISLLFLSSCQIEYTENEPKKIEIEGTSYSIYKASDSCEYYAIKTKVNYVEKSEYYHYAQCAWCKKHK